MKNALILAAGKSTRFGRDKLEERFAGHTLVYHAAKWAMENGATRICCTISRHAVRTDGRKLEHAILDDLSTLCEPEIRFQSDTAYGPGAAIAEWASAIEEPVTVLFGDNYYSGTMPLWAIAGCADPDEPAVMFSFSKRTHDPRNLQLAAVDGDYIVEKPHGRIAGKFFCGFARLPQGYLQRLGTMRKSDRGEVEIADIVNMANHRMPLDLQELGLTWADLTYESDRAHVRSLFAARE